MASKRKISKNIKSLWRKQSEAIKIAIVAGVFSIIVAFCGLATNLITISVDNLPVATPSPNITVTLLHDNFNWSTLYLQDIQFPDTHASIITNTCLQFFVDGNDNVYEEIQTSDSQKLRGTIGVLVITDQPVVIKQIDFDVTSFEPLKEKEDLPIFFDLGQGGGGSPVNEVMLDGVTIMSFPEKHANIQNKPYELEERTAMTFMLPVEFVQEGFYTYQVRITINSFNSQFEEVLSLEKTIGWAYINQIKPDELKSGPSVPEDVQISIFKCP